MSKITDTVAAIAAPVAEKHGCALWDVEYVKEAGTFYLRVFIDREGGVSIEQCEAVSRELDPILDGYEELIPSSYIFEVSSAGAERPLKRPSDFALFLGHLVEVKLYQQKNGAKEHLGALKAYDGGAVELEENGETVRYEKAEVANVRLRIKI
jgi:ribosome maturation factor RimP